MPMKYTVYIICTALLENIMSAIPGIWPPVWGSTTVGCFYTKAIYLYPKKNLAGNENLYNFIP
jgi:hypothetical protein